MKLNKTEFLNNCTYEVESKNTYNVITNNEWYKRIPYSGEITIKLVHRDNETNKNTTVCKVTITKIISSFFEIEEYLDYDMAKAMSSMDNGLKEVAETLGLFDEEIESEFYKKYESEFHNMFCSLEYGNLYVVTDFEFNKAFRGKRIGNIIIEDLPDLICKETGDDMPTIAVLSYPYSYKDKDKETLDKWHKRLYKFYSSCKNDLIEITPNVFYHSPTAHVYNDRRLITE